MVFVSKTFNIDGTEFVITDEAKAADLAMRKEEKEQQKKLTDSIEMLRRVLQK